VSRCLLSSMQSVMNDVPLHGSTQVLDFTRTRKHILPRRRVEQIA